MRTLLATAALVFLAIPVALASTTVSLNGTGNVEITASGDIYLDMAGLELTDLTLVAEDEIRLGEPFPEGPVDDFIDLEGVIEGTDLFVEGDANIEALVFVGNLELRARSIFVNGGIYIDGVLSVTTGSIDESGTSGGDCDDLSSGVRAGSNLIISNGEVVEIVTQGAGTACVVITTGENVIIGGIGTIVIIPEPASSVLGYVALAVLAVLARRTTPFTDRVC